MMGVHVRVKCPCCGMQVSQNRMNEDYLPLELSTFEVVNLGNRKGGFRWLRNVSVSGKELLLVGLRNKLERLLAAVERELNPEMTSGSEMTVPSVGATSALLSTPTRMEISTLRSTGTRVVMSTGSRML